MKTIITIGPLRAELDSGERQLPGWFEPYRSDAAAAPPASDGAGGAERQNSPLIRVPCPDEAARQRERKALMESGEKTALTGETLEREIFLTALYRGLAEQLPARQAAVFHGSCLALEGEAFLFLAPSGTGKSTHSRLWRQVFGERVLMVNDDKPVLLLEDGRVLACGTPWNGKHRLGNPGAWPLKGLCLLSRGAQNRIAPVEPGRALATFYPFMYRPAGPEALFKTLALADEIAARVPVYTLQCNMDPEAALVSCRGMREEKQ